MQQENDDMDELLRKAAENYPLKTDNADWEKVRLALAAGSFSNEPVKSKSYKSLWLLLLLLPLGWGSYYYFSSSTPSDKVVAVNGNAGKKDKSSQTVSSQNEITVVKKTIKLQTETVNSNTNTIHVTKAAHLNISRAENFNTVTIRLQRKNNAGNLLTGSKTSVAIDQASSEEENNKAAIENEKNLKNRQVQIVAIDKNVNTDSKEKTDITVTTNDEKKINQSVKKDSKNKKQKNNFLYAGVIAGPDISTIKFQSVKSTGMNIGIVLGYQLNKKLSVETGWIRNKKFYYSEGRYFNTGKIYLPPNAKISDVTGNCKMIEVPLNVKYNLITSDKATWFSAVGLSSYFMKQESYRYTVVSTGAPYPYDKTYKKHSQYLLSVLNIGAGYNHLLGKVGTFRIEPYVKIPLRGVGIGSLPITSAGVNVGITKNIF